MPAALLWEDRAVHKYSPTAWRIASLYSHALASETRDLAAHIDSAIARERERCASIAIQFGDFAGEKFVKELRVMCGNAIADKIREAPAMAPADRGGGR